MQEIRELQELNQIVGGLSPNQGAIIEGAIAAGSFALGFTGVGLLATMAVIACAAMMDE